MTSKMINFRATEAEADALEDAAKRMGMTKSDLIKTALKNFLGGGTTPKPQLPGPVCVTGTPSASCSKAVWVKRQDGSKICQVCTAIRT
jgi:hypothetical protein